MFAASSCGRVQTEATPSGISISREPPTLVAHHHLEFPQELVDLIVDALSDDRIALNACSMTCRAWTYRSQFRLHRHLRFTNVKHLTSNPSRYDDPVLAGYVHSLDKIGRAHV